MKKQRKTFRIIAEGGVEYLEINGERGVWKIRDYKNCKIDVKQLERWKRSTPESRLEWLAAAVEFARAKKRI